MRINSDLQNRVAGCIFGSAVGDALGLGTEFLTKWQVVEYYPEGLKDYSNFVRDKHRSYWKQGEWTDDTDQMLCILDSILANERIEILDIAKRFHSWAFNGGRGLGRTVYSVLSSPDFLQDPNSAAQRVWNESGNEMAANGALMRTSVLGLWPLNDREKIVANTIAVAQITHYDPRCTASCVAVTLAINNLIRQQKLFEEAMTDAESIACAMDERVRVSFDLAKQCDIAKLELGGRHIGFTLKSLAAAFWTMYNSGSFEEGVKAVIHEGGDADTNAAIAGAMLGARFGFESIPQHLIAGLSEKEALERRVENLFVLVENAG